MVSPVNVGWESTDVLWGDGVSSDEFFISFSVGASGVLGGEFFVGHVSKLVEGKSGRVAFSVVLHDSFVVSGEDGESFDFFFFSVSLLVSVLPDLPERTDFVDQGFASKSRNEQNGKDE